VVDKVTCGKIISSFLRGMDKMENITGRDSQNAEKSLRKPYQAPQLVNLGQIQTLVQAGSNEGNDGATNALCCGVS
jgi:hypothetical protein